MAVFAVARVRRLAQTLAATEVVTFDILAQSLKCDTKDIRDFVIGVTHLCDELQQIMPANEFRLATRAQTTIESELPVQEIAAPLQPAQFYTEPESIAATAVKSAAAARLEARVRRAQCINERVLSTGRIPFLSDGYRRPSPAQEERLRTFRKTRQQKKTLRKLLDSTRQSAVLGV